MNINNMYLATLDLLHIYVTHDVELTAEIFGLTRIKREDALDCVKFCECSRSTSMQHGSLLIFVTR
jgi:hypothetical protein